MAVCNAIPQLLPEIRIASLHQYVAHDISSTIKALRITDHELADRFVIDNEHPDFVIASDTCLYHVENVIKLKHYLLNNKEAIFILFCPECIDPDLNVFDYAVVWNSDLKCGDRIARNLPCIYSEKDNDTYKNTLSIDEARKILDSKPKFCCFVYSHSSEQRDSFFRLLSQHKHVDSLGRWLNNTGTKSTRYDANWYELSINIKSGYKFSIAMENASYRGYTTEKIISSLQAHTVPIYWGDPAVTDCINPKAFINCHDYSSFDEVIERVKEIDNNDELWLDMVTQPWQTEEQYSRTLQVVRDYESFMHNIFTQDIKTARRRPVGYWGSYCRKKFTGYAGEMPSSFSKLLRKLKLTLAAHMSENVRIKLKKLFGVH